MGRYDSPLSVATLFVGATFVSVALIFLFDAEASSRLSRTAKPSSVISTLQQEQQLLQEQTTEPLQRVQRSTTLKDLDGDVPASSTLYDDKTSSTGVGGVFAFFSGKIKDLFKRHHRWKRSLLDDDQAAEETDKDSSSEEDYDDDDDDDDQEPQEPLALFSKQKFQPDYPPRSSPSSSSSSSSNSGVGPFFSSESKTALQSQPGSSSLSQLSSSAANFHKIRHAMKKLGDGGLDFSAVERMMVDSNPPIRPRIPEKSGNSGAPEQHHHNSKHSGVGHGSQRAKPPPPPLPRFDDDKFDTMSSRRSHVSSIDSPLPTGIFSEPDSVGSRSYGRVSFAPLESPRDSSSSPISPRATTHSATSTVTESIERDRRASMASTTAAQQTPSTTAPTFISNSLKAYATYFERPSVVANTSWSSAWRSSSPSSSSVSSESKQRFTLDPFDDTERRFEADFPVVFPDTGDHDKSPPLQETSTTQRHYEPQIPALQSGIYYHHQSQDHVDIQHQVSQSTNDHQTSHNHNNREHVARSGQPAAEKGTQHSHRSIKETYDQEDYYSSSELGKKSHHDPDDDQMPAPVSSSTVPTLATRLDQIHEIGEEDDSEDQDDVPESDLAGSSGNGQDDSSFSPTYGFVDPATKRAILRENLEICYKTDDVLIVVAITCCLNFAFVLVIWGCVRWFSISSSAKDREFHHLDCEDAGDSILFHEDEGTAEPHQHDESCCWKRRVCLDLDSDTGNVTRRKCKNCGKDKDTINGRQQNTKQLEHDTLIQTHPQQQVQHGTLSNDKRMVTASDFAESGKISSSSSSFKQSSILSLRHHQHEHHHPQQQQQLEDPYNSLVSLDQPFPKSHVPSLRRPSDKFHFVLQKHYQRNLKEFGLGFIPTYNSQEEEAELRRGGYGENEDVVVENNYHPTFDNNPFYNQSNYYPPSYNSHHHNHHQHYSSSTTNKHSRETSNSPPRISSSLYSFRQQQQQQQLLQKQQSNDKIIVPRRKPANPNTFSPSLSSASSSAASSLSSLTSRKSKEKSYSHSMEDLRCVHT